MDIKRESEQERKSPVWVHDSNRHPELSDRAVEMPVTRHLHLYRTVCSRELLI